MGLDGDKLCVGHGVETPAVRGAAPSDSGDRNPAGQMSDAFADAVKKDLEGNS
jgi:hypothetical protein